MRSGHEVKARSRTSVPFSHSVMSNSTTPWTAARQASLCITNSWSLLKLTSIESVMPSSHLILCCPLLLLPSIPPSIRVLSNESTLRVRWPKYWSFSFSISPSNEHPGLISFRMNRSYHAISVMHFNALCHSELLFSPIPNLVLLKSWISFQSSKCFKEKETQHIKDFKNLAHACSCHDLKKEICMQTIHSPFPFQVTHQFDKIVLNFSSKLFIHCKKKKKVEEDKSL